MSWHADPDLLIQYARGTIDEARAYSIEAHITGCDTCRDRLAGIYPRDRLDPLWTRIDGVLDTPRPGIVERVMLAVGIPDHVARLLSATPSLRLSWFASITVALAFAVVASYAAGGPGAFRPFELLPFLVVAPLVPLAGVAMAYGPGVDPTYEVGLAAPMRGDRLLLIRTVAVLVTSMGLAALVAFALPGTGWTPAWLLPSLALSAVSVALSTSIHAGWAFGWMAALWIAGVVVSEGLSNETLPLFRPSAQAVFAGAILVAAIVIATRRESFEVRRHV